MTLHFYVYTGTVHILSSFFSRDVSRIVSASGHSAASPLQAGPTRRAHGASTRAAVAAGSIALALKLAQRAPHADHAQSGRARLHDAPPRPQRGRTGSKPLKPVPNGPAGGLSVISSWSSANISHAFDPHVLVHATRGCRAAPARTAAAHPALRSAAHHACAR